MIRGGPTMIRGDRLFDGVAFHEGPWWAELAGARINAVGRGEAPAVRDVLDARGLTVLPGLINTHAHLARGGMFSPSEPMSPRQVAMNLESTLSAGVTTVAELGCSAALARTLRELTHTRPELGPAIVAAGPILTVPGGYPFDWMPDLYARLGVAIACGTESGAARAVRGLAEGGMTHVKVAVMHRSYSDRELPALDAPRLHAIVREAHALGMRVLAHAHSVADYRVALAGGVDALVHSSFEPLDDETLETVSDAGVSVTPTLWVFESVCLGAEGAWHDDPRYSSLVTRAVRNDWRRFTEAWRASGDVVPAGIAGGLEKSRIGEAIRNAAANLRLLHDRGVPIAFGSDASYGYSQLGRPLDELLAMARAGMDAVQCLRAATSGSASLLGLTDRGRIEEGRRADLFAVEGDPRADLAALGRVRWVLHGGTPVPQGGGRARWRQRALAAGAVGLGTAATVTAAIRGRR